MCRLPNYALCGREGYVVLLVTYLYIGLFLGVIRTIMQESLYTFCHTAVRRLFPEHRRLGLMTSFPQWWWLCSQTSLLWFVEIGVGVGSGETTQPTSLVCP